MDSHLTNNNSKLNEGTKRNRKRGRERGRERQIPK